MNKKSVSKAHDTAIGPDNNHCQVLKHLPDESFYMLLDVFNEIWVSGQFPHSWRQAKVIPIPKPGKMPLILIIIIP